MLLADEFFLLVRDETGRLRLHDRATRLGTAAALVAELLLSRHFQLRDGQVLTTRTAEPPADATAHAVWEMVRREPQVMGLRSWLMVLAQFAVDRVGDRLAASGVVRRSEVRRLLRPPVVRWAPVSLNATAAPVVRLRGAAQRLTPLRFSDQVLLAIVDAAGLREAVLWGVDGSGTRYVDDLIDQLPAQWSELARCLGEELASNALTYR